MNTVHTYIGLRDATIDRRSYFKTYYTYISICILSDIILRYTSFLLVSTELNYNIEDFP